MRRIIWCLILLIVSLPNLASAGQFKKPVSYSVPGLPFAVVTADFNGDGNLDLAVSDFALGTVRTLLGKGDGTFRKGPSFTLPQGYSPWTLTTGDFDKNGTVDLAVVEYAGPADGQLGIYLGNGDGSFREFATYPVGYEPNFVAAADLNGNRNLDLLVTNNGVNGAGSLAIFSGKGNGRFQLTKTFDFTGYPSSVAAGDLSGNGRADLAVAVDPGITVLQNKGNGRFSKGVLYPVPQRSVVDVVIADVNHDKKLDLVATAYHAIAVLLNEGGGKFGKATTYSTKSLTQEYYPTRIVVADFNQDGNPDIATVLAGFQNAGLLYGKGDGTFKNVVPIKLKIPTSTEGIVAGDFNKNLSPDLAILDGGGVAEILINTQ